MNKSSGIMRLVSWIIKSIIAITAVVVVVCLLSGHSLRQSGLFVWRAVKNPMTVGAAVPTLGFAAEALIDVVPAKGKNRRLIEVGAGSGAITRLLVKKLQPGDILDVVEIDPGLVSILQEKFGNHSQVRIHNMSITDWRPSYRYDAIVTSVPFNSLPAPLIKQVWQHLQGLSKPGARTSYIKLIGVAEVKGLLMRGERRVDYVKGRTFMENLNKKFGVGQKTILANMPPAVIYYIQFN